MTRLSRKASGLAFWVTCGSGFIIWSALYLRIYLNADFAWLFIVAERFWDGGTYSADFRETNPPLSFLIYLPAVWLYRIFSWSPHFSIYLTTLTYLSAAAVCSYRLVAHLGLSSRERMAFTVAMVFSATWLMGASFGQRDHIIFIWLVPALLTQLLLIKEVKLPRTFKIAASSMGALAIALKPPYLVLPAAFYLYRFAIKREGFALMKGTDFWTYPVIGAGYLLFIALVFPDFFPLLQQEIIPLYITDADYAADTGRDLSLVFLFLLFPVLAAIFRIIAKEDINPDSRPLIDWAIFISLLSLLPYYVQGKGFYYHMMPIIGFGGLACFLMIFYLFRQKLDFYAALLVTLVIGMATCLPFSYGMAGPFASHDDFRDIPLHEKIEQYAGGDSYVFFSAAMLSNLGIPYYIDTEWGSRFPFFWQLAALIDSKETEAPEIPYYISLIAEDLERYTPNLVIIPNSEGIQPDTFLSFLLTNPLFARAWQGYHYQESIILDGSVYHRGLGWGKEPMPVKLDLYVYSQSESDRP